MLNVNTILLIDDSDAILELNEYYIAAAFKFEEIIFAQNGEVALKLVSELTKQPDLIFLDIKMPVMDGFEFLEKYELLNLNTTNTKVILLSSSTNPNDLKRAKKYKIIKGIFEKPLNHNTIKSIKSLF